MCIVQCSCQKMIFKIQNTLYNLVPKMALMYVKTLPPGIKIGKQSEPSKRSRKKLDFYIYLLFFISRIPYS